MEKKTEGSESSKLLRLLCGGITGATVKTAVAPLERLKILYETQTMFTTVDKLKYTGLINSIQITWQESGLRGFWRGNGANLLRVVPNSAIKFSTFDTYKKLLLSIFPNENTYFIRTILSGALSGGSQILVTYPLDVVRTRVAVFQQYKGTIDCITKTFRNEGARGFYQGIGLTVLSVMPYVGISLTIYDSCKKYLLPKDAPIFYRLMPGAIGSISAGCCTFPFDVVRRRLQLEGSDQSKPRIYNGATDCARIILKNEGIYGFYRGLSLQILKSAPSTSLQFVTYDLLKKIVGLE